MRAMTLFALCAVFLFCWSTPGSTQSSGEDVLSAAFDMAPPQRETVQTRAGVLTADMVQDRVGQRNFFAFEPSYRDGVRVARSGDNPQGDDGVVVGSKNGGRYWYIGQPHGPLQTYFAFDPAFRSGSNAIPSSE